MTAWSPACVVSMSRAPDTVATLIAMTATRTICQTPEPK